jgi:hypothetical protein
MSWTERIDVKKYAIGTAINMGFALWSGWPSPLFCGWLIVLIVSIALNHYFTVRVFTQLVTNRARPSASNKKLVVFLILKMLTLFAGFVCLLVFVRDKVLHGMLLYIFQLIILFLSIKNIGQFIKKGPPT